MRRRFYAPHRYPGKGFSKSAVIPPRIQINPDTVLMLNAMMLTLKKNAINP